MCGNVLRTISVPKFKDIMEFLLKLTYEQSMAIYVSNCMFVSTCTSSNSVLASWYYLIKFPFLSFYSSDQPMVDDLRKICLCKDDFEVLNTIGRGHFGQVLLKYHRHI